jgi:peptidoglycan/xylan/chitin deacetylase (PgdA/CDA1 family)
MIHTSWNVDTLDWQDRNANSIFERTKKQVDILGRGIILFHDIHPQSVQAVKLLIPYMKKVKDTQIKPLKSIISIVREKSFESP